MRSYYQYIETYNLQVFILMALMSFNAVYGTKSENAKLLHKMFQKEGYLNKSDTHS